MARTEEANQRIRSIQRGRILDAARTVFARKGLSATMDDVAEEAGVSHGLAYRYFANKTALVSELVIEDLQAPAGWLVQFANEGSAPSDKIRQMITGLLESRHDHPEQYQLLAQVLYDESAPADLRDEVAKRRRKIQVILRHLITAGQVAGRVAPGDPDQLVRAVLATLDGLTAWHSSDPATHRATFPDAEIILRMLMP